MCTPFIDVVNSPASTIRLGIQIPNFEYGTGVARMFPTVVAQAREADAAGYDSVFLMDHFYQLPVVGPPDLPVLEAYTALGALATATERAQLGVLVTGNTYRNPALLAKIVTTLDVISQGRAILGMGTGYFELEHDAYGFDYGSFTERFDKLAEAMDVIEPMLAGDRPTYEGTYYRTREAMAEPRFRDRIPLLIGGSGERRTIPLAVQRFDHLNIPIQSVPFAELPGKVDAVTKACEGAGRDPNTLETSAMVPVFFGDDLEAHGLPVEFAAGGLYGSAEQIADQVVAKILDAGVDGVILGPLTKVQGYLPGKMTEVAELLAPILAR